MRELGVDGSVERPEADVVELSDPDGLRIQIGSGAERQVAGRDMGRS